ncbi:hypothetical protein V2J09_012635 [Rumex salicifolius]
MAVAKDRIPPSNSFMLEGSSAPSSPVHFLNLSSLSSSSNFYIFEDDNYPKQLSPQREDDNKSPSPPLSSSSSANYGNGFGAHHEAEFGDHRSLLDYGGSNLVSFQPQGRCHNFGSDHQPNHDEYNPMWEDSNITGNDHQQLKLTNEWLYDEGHESDPMQQHTSINNKRNLMEDDNVQTLKKQCTSNGASSKKQPSKSKSSTITSKDPQSVAAKNRRERISERLKILQDLVPNGSKVDMVTMLDKAISYVKFLQLQAKVLATDEFWPAAGGKPPNISQVKEAIDAILSSQRDSPSSSIDRSI